MSNQEEPQVEPRHDSDRLEEVRAWGERNEKRVKDLEAKLATQTAINRASAVRAAGLDPDSYRGMGVMALVERDDISDPNVIAQLVQVTQAEGAPHAS